MPPESKPSKPTIEKLQPGDPDTQSADVVAENIARLKALFPELVTEGKDGASVNVDVLKQLVGDATVSDCDEKFGLNWHGKRRARQLALTPSTGTLRPCPEESVDWDTTQNLFIEGDNLEVLKLLQKSYAGRVKMIYIDPPYNTGKDFVYPDAFQNSIQQYLKLSGQAGGDGLALTSNPESSGRFHTDWLSMMLPRLKAAWSLLKPDGVIYISIHHREVSHLRRLCDELYGEENFIGMITWKARVKPVNIGEAKYRPQGETEYVLGYQRSDVGGKFQPLITGGLRSYPHELEGRPYRLQTILKSNRGSNYRTTMSFELDGYTPPEGQRWQAGEDEIKRLNIEGYIEFKDGTPFRRYFEDEEGAEHDPFYCFMDSEWSSTSEAGKHEVNELLGESHGFDTVKPTRLLRTLIQSITRPQESDIVLDFFAGSGTTMHAQFLQNAEDGGNRRTILVQFPEPLEPTDTQQRTAALFCQSIEKPLNIAEITKERIRRAGAAIINAGNESDADFGFRVFKLDSSNIREWEPSREGIAESLEAHVENLRADRTEQDILYELLLKRGLDLCVPIETKEIAGKTVHSIGAGTLFACLSESITADEGEPLALGIAGWHQELDPAGDTTVVFRDSAFADDVVKSNVAAILDQSGLKNVRSL